MHKEYIDDYINLLKKIAINSNISSKHAAALIHSNRIYSSGYNHYITNVKDDKNDRTIHAEISIFENISKKIAKGLDIIVIRVNNNLILKNSRPCNHCIEQLKKIGIRKIFYSNENGIILCEFVDKIQKKHISKGNKRNWYRD